MKRNGKRIKRNIYQAAKSLLSCGDLDEIQSRLIEEFNRDQVGWYPSGILHSVCTIPGLWSRSVTCVHFVNKGGCKHMAWCIHQKPDDSLELRKHEIGKCPDSEYCSDYDNEET